MRDKARIYEIRIISTIQILGINNQISFLHDNLRSDRNTPLYYSLYALNAKKKKGGVIQCHVVISLRFNEIRMKIQTTNFFGILISTRLVMM
jgi:hypothetical protein